MKSLFTICLLILGLALHAQVNVSGRITDADGNGIPFASVGVKGGTTGTTANEQGAYNLSVANTSVTLVFSAVNYSNKEELVGNRSVINVSLESELTALDEVVVVAYGTVRKTTFTGSVANMSEKQLSKFQSADVAKSLEGALAGVSVSSESGQPGKDTKLRIRGVGSINASSEPLIIVDGAPYDGSLSSINSSDIASINILKDAASAALYGARGANGVVMVTTKTGKTGATRVNLDMKVGYNFRGVPEYNVMTSPQEYYETQWEGLYNKSLYTDKKTDTEARAYASSQLYPVLGYNSYNVANDQIVLADGKLNPEAAIKYKDSKWNDWDDALFTPQLRQEYNLSISRGNETDKFYFSLGYLDDKGYNKNSGFDRYSSRLSYDSKLFSWLHAGASMQLSRTESKWTTEGGSYTNTFGWTRMIAPIYPIYEADKDGNYILDANGDRTYDFGEIKSGHGTRAYGAKNNPVATQDKDTDTRTDYYINNNMFVNISLPYDFTLSSTATFYGNWYARNRFVTPVGGAGLTYNGNSTKRKVQTTAVNWNQILKWEKKFNDFSLQAMLGHEIYSKNIEYLLGEKSNFLDPENSDFDNAAKIGVLSSNKQPYRLEGVFSQVTVDYLSKYFASASIRQDKSSVFHPDNRTGYFWSVGGGWRISEENFMKDVSFVDNLKFKISYGLQGNDYLYLPNTSPGLRSYTPYKSLYEVTSDGENLGLTPVYKGRKEVTWEKNYNFNTGIEFSILKGLLSADIEYFQRKTKDLLFNLPVPSSTGFSTEPWNIGDMVNKGVDITLSSNVLSLDRIRWTVSANLTHYTNKVLNLPDQFKEKGITRTYQLIKEGGSIYDFYMARWGGVDPTNGDAKYWIKNDNGDFENVNSAGYNTDSRQIVGSGLPKVTGGFGSNLEFYDFDFGMQFSYRIGGKVYDGAYRDLMERGAGNNYHKDITDRWTPNNTDTNTPRIEYNNQNLTQSSDRFLIDGSFLSFRNVTLGYTLPKQLVTKIGISGLRVYFVADNVALWSKRKGFDPRTSFGGYNRDGENNLYSPIRTTSLGLVLNL